MAPFAYALQHAGAVLALLVTSCTAAGVAAGTVLAAHWEGRPALTVNLRYEDGSASASVVVQVGGAKRTVAARVQ